MSDEQTTADGGLEIEEQQNAYRVQLPSFEGPLDLLLHLIKKHELDILDIPIGFISKKYVEYIKTMELLSIDLASEYLVMAATLAHIKSRSLLPPDPSQAAEDDLLAEEEDPRAELIRRLLEYQKYKNAAENLSGRAVLGRDVFTRGAPNDETIGPAPLAQLSLFKLVDAFEAVLTRAKRVEDHQIDFERISISERIGQISELLRQRGQQRFEQLFEEDATRADMIVTFLALLEMTKLRMTSLRQDGPLEPIYIELSMTYDEEDEDALAGASASKDQSWVSEFDEEEAEDQSLLDEDAADEDEADEDEADEDEADEEPSPKGDAHSGEADEAPLDLDSFDEYESQPLAGSDESESFPEHHEGEPFPERCEDDSDGAATVSEAPVFEESLFELAESASQAVKVESGPEHAPVHGASAEDAALLQMNQPSHAAEFSDGSPPLDEEGVAGEPGISSEVLLGAMASYVASALDQEQANVAVTPDGLEEYSAVDDSRRGVSTPEYTEHDAVNDAGSSSAEDLPVEEPFSGLHPGPAEEEPFATPEEASPLGEQDDCTSGDESVSESNSITTPNKD